MMQRNKLVEGSTIQSRNSSIVSDSCVRGHQLSCLTLASEKTKSWVYFMLKKKEEAIFIGPMQLKYETSPFGNFCTEVIEMSGGRFRSVQQWNLHPAKAPSGRIGVASTSRGLC